MKIGKKPRKIFGMLSHEDKNFKSAKNDLREGFYFYESQQAGLGTYFLETLSSDNGIGVMNIHPNFSFLTPFKI